MIEKTSIKVGLDLINFYSLISDQRLLMPDSVAQSDTRVAGQLVCLKTPATHAPECATGSSMDRCPKRETTKSHG